MTAEQMIKRVEGIPENRQESETEMVLKSVRKPAPVPESKQDRLKRLIRSRVDTQEFAAEVVAALEDVSKIPGIGEQSRWGIVKGVRFKAGASWEISEDDFDPAQMESELNSAIQKALDKWKQREKTRESYSVQIASFLHKAKTLENDKLLDSALDLVYDSIDELFRRGQFALCDAILSETQPSEYSTDILLALLTAVSPAKSKLASHRRFFRAVRNVLKDRGDYERSLLEGLG